MWETLDQIPWGELSHAYGEADDVPGLLRDLASPDGETRREALYALCGNIYHQGTVYEATAYAVPFLVELLQNPAVLGKDDVLGLLHAAAGGSSYLEAHQHFDSYRDERETEEFNAEREEELRWVRATHHAVLDGVPVYLALLSHTESEVRVMACFVLSACIAQQTRITPVLRGRWDAENDPAAKASVSFALALLARIGSEPDRAEVQGLLAGAAENADEPALVRFAAALGMVLLGGEATLSQAVPILRETAPQCADTVSRLPWELGETPVAAASVLLAPHPRARLAWLLEMGESDAAENRLAAVYEIEELCQEHRFAAPEVVLPLARLITDPDARVRKQAAQTLPNLGTARRDAIPTLTDLRHNHPDPDVRLLAEETQGKVEAVRDTYHLDRWLKKPQEARSVAEWIVLLESGKPGDSGDAATALEFVGPPAVEAVPALRHALHHSSHWVRVRVARALWKIARDAASALPILLEEMQCRPAGLLVLDCLADMEGEARAAVPALRHIIESPVRLVESGSNVDWIDEDEAFCAAAQRALDAIAPSA